MDFESTASANSATRATEGSKESRHPGKVHPDFVVPADPFPADIADQYRINEPSIREHQRNPRRTQADYFARLRGIRRGYQPDTPLLRATPLREGTQANVIGNPFRERGLAGRSAWRRLLPDRAGCVINPSLPAEPST